MRIVYHQELRPRVVKVSHEFGLAGAPMSSELQPQCREQLVAQSLLIFNVSRSRNRKHRRRTHPLGHVADAHRFPAPWIGDDHMPAPFVPGITEHRLKPLSKRGFNKKILSEEWMCHRENSSPNMRTGRGLRLVGTGSRNNKQDEWVTWEANQLHRYRCFRFLGGLAGTGLPA